VKKKKGKKMVGESPSPTRGRKKEMFNNRGAFEVKKGGKKRGQGGGAKLKNSGTKDQKGKSKMRRCNKIRLENVQVLEKIRGGKGKKRSEVSKQEKNVKKKDIQKIRNSRERGK